MIPTHPPVFISCGQKYVPSVTFVHCTHKYCNNIERFSFVMIQCCARQLKIACTDIGIDRAARKFQTISGKT